MTREAAGALKSSKAWLEVRRLDRTDWRISDARLDVGSDDRLLGYVERLGRWRYEVLWVTAPFGWAYVKSLDLAVAAVADREHFVGVIRSERAEGFSWEEPPLLPVSYRRRDIDIGGMFSRHKKGVPTSRPVEDEPERDPVEAAPNGMPDEIASGESSPGMPLDDGSESPLRAGSAR
jgi:hypothetical protein